MNPSTPLGGLSASARGWFRSLPSPTSRTPSSLHTLEKTIIRPLLADVSIPAVLLYVILPLSVGFLLFQGHLSNKAMTVFRTQEPALAFGLDRINSTIYHVVVDRINHQSKPRELGYVEVTIPDQVLKFLDEVGKDFDSASDPTDELSIKKAPVEAERHPVRLTPVKSLGPVVTPTMPPRPQYTKKEAFELTWSYDMDEKLPAFVGNKEWMDKFPKDSRAYYNSLATFPYASNTGPMHRYHGHVGIYPNGTQAWKSIDMPPPIEEAPLGRKEAMKNGGFYLALSNALPLDREPEDHRDDVCKTETWDYSKLRDASVIITFHNEPLSTLLRSVHSVLNQTPPPILREIILVDDHSNLTENMPGSELYDYLQVLPKVKLLRLPERRGLVWARMAGAQAAKAPVLVVLDSHIEVNPGWLEPQLARLVESPKSVVFPQVMALTADKFEYHRHAGIGCWLSWKWNMVERSTLTGKITKTDPIASPSMAGGLFAVNVDWFWEMGGYDEEFAMWGSENVEMGFRSWLCGGRLECMPCSRTYHIYRDGGIGYTSPSEAVWRNKVRTARLWMDEWFQVASKFIGRELADVGNLDHVLELKQRLKCKPFSWFFENVDPDHDGRDLNKVEILGAVTNVHYDSHCLDTMGHLKENETYGTFHCHGGGGSQGWYKYAETKWIKPFLDEAKCITKDYGLPVFVGCWQQEKANRWTISESGQLVFDDNGRNTCLSIIANGTKLNLGFEDCDSSNDKQRWTFERFTPDPQFARPDFSPEYKKLHGLEG